MWEIALAGTIPLGTAVLLFFLNRRIELQRNYLSTTRIQLEHVFSPLERICQVNYMEFKRYTARRTTNEDKDFIEREVWYPNHLETKRILMEESHYLEELPKPLLDLLIHINVWLTVYDQKHPSEATDSRDFAGPVFAGPKGYGFPKGADTFIYEQANRLRRALKPKRFGVF